MAIEFNPDSGKLPAKKSVKPQGAPKKTDVKTALGFIKSLPEPPAEKEPTSEELFDKLMSGEIDHKEYTEALKNLPEGIPDEE